MIKKEYMKPKLSVEEANNLSPIESAITFGTDVAGVIPYKGKTRVFFRMPEEIRKIRAERNELRKTVPLLVSKYKEGL